MKQFFQYLQLFYLRSTFRLLGWFNPPKAAARALRMMSTPRPFPLKEREQSVLDQAEQSTIPYRDGNIQIYRWGEDAPTVLIVHGWEGQAGNFGGIITRLIDEGWSVLAFDAPSHGQSDVQPTSMFDFAACLGELLKDRELDAIIAHSFGSVATAIALSQHVEARLGKLVMIASPNRFEDRLQQIVDLFGLSSVVTECLRLMLKSSTDYPIFDLSVGDMGDQINVGDRLLLHDKNDQVSLFRWSQDIAKQWPQSAKASTELVAVEGTGHNRILWDDGVIEKIACFLQKDV